MIIMATDLSSSARLVAGRELGVGLLEVEEAWDG